MNTLKTFMLMLVLMLLFMWLGFLFGGSSGMLFAFVFASLLNFGMYWFSDKLVLKMYKAREVNETDHPRLYRIVKSVAQKAMLPMPKIYIVPSQGPNAFATGRNPQNAAVAATEGILQILSDDELEGVIGHEMAHIQNRDMLIGTIAATFAGAIGYIAHMAQWGAIFGGYGGRSDENRGGGGMIGVLVAAIVAPLAAMLLQTAISRQREYKADAEGGRITGKYHGLASALDKLHRSPVQLNLTDKPATANLMIINPLSGKGLVHLFSTHPPVQERIKRLRDLAQHSVYTGFTG